MTIIALLTAVLVACTSGHASTFVATPGSTDAPGTTAAGPTTTAPLGTDESLTVGTPVGVAVIDPSTAAIQTAQPSAVSSGDGSRWLTSTPGDTTTRVGVFDPATRAELGSLTVDGTWNARVASPTGGAVALTNNPLPVMENYLAPPRARTSLMVVHARDGDARSQVIDLEGNFEPEAFSVDHTSLFILQFTPPLAPERYRVRRLDLATGTVQDVVDRDKRPQGDMPGQARTQVRSPDGSALYTLYTVDAGHGHHEGPHAFVHVLDLKNQFAHCIDLPQPFGAARQEVAALAITPDGDGLFAVDRAAGAIASIDTTNLTVTATAPIEARPDATLVTAAVGANDRLFVGTDDDLTTIDRRDLHQIASRRITMPAAALYESPVSHRLYAASGPAIAVFTPEGKQLRIIDLVALGPIMSIGPGAGPLPAQREVLQCAC